MKQFSVNELAKLAGVSVRTLHHYDAIGLLKPAERSETRYRVYTETELLRLQQILFYRELDIPLSKIVEILDSPDFNIHDALVSHRAELKKRKQQLTELLNTICKTIIHLKTKIMKFEDMYKGFTKEQAIAYEKEATERWGVNLVEESKQRITKMGKEGLDALRKEGEDINKELAANIHLSPTDDKIQALIKRHFNMTNQYYTLTVEIYSGLAEMYVADERFKQNYDKYHPQLSYFLREVMLVFCKSNLQTD